MPTAAVKVVYQDRQAVESFLGEEGINVLGKVLNLIQEVSAREGWPLERIEVNHQRDYEYPEWQHALVLLVFDSLFTSADTYLSCFFQYLDVLRDSLTSKDDAVIVEFLSFNVLALREV